MYARTLTSLAAVTVLAASLSAQSQIWIVDAANGPGTHFRFLGTAVAAASPGDRLLVRPGSYPGFATSKPLSIVGGPGVMIIPGGAAYAGLAVFGIPAGSGFLARGLDVQNLPLGSGVSASGCAGTVVFEDVVQNVPIQITDCADVRLTGCSAPGLTIARSSASVERCTFRGGATAGWAVQVDSSSVVFSRCDLEGRVQLGALPAGPAIEAVASTLIVTGDGSGRVAAGSGTLPASAIVGTGSLILDPNVTVVPSGAAPAVAASLATTVRSIPSLRADGSPVGGTVHVEVFAPVGHVYLLVVGLPATPVLLPALSGSLWLDGAIIAATGSLPSSGRATFSLPVPNNMVLFGRAFTWQAAAGDPVTGSVALSNPSTYVHGQ